MADLNVSFIHPIDGRTIPVILDDDITASEAVEVLIQRNVLDADSQNYNLVKQGGASIWPDQTFKDAGIRENDIIRINHRKTPKIDNEIFKIRVNNLTTATILLGSGASAPSGIATVNGLLAQLWKNAKKIGRDDLNPLITWCENNNITNIEDLLTASYFANFAVKKENVLSLFDYFLFARRREQLEGVRPLRLSRKDTDEVSLISFQDTLQILFGLLASTMIAAQPNAAHKAILDFITQHEDTSIVTTNYDGCMDEAIARAIKNDARNPKIKDVIKMHGAINWSCCDSCQHIHKTDLLDLKEAYGSDKLNFAVIGFCKKCGGLTRPLLVPPLSFKFAMFRELYDIWSLASKAFEKAHYLIVVGYSFSESDTYISKMILHSMTTNPNQKILIIDTNSNLGKVLREKFSVHIDNFDETRVLQACASCDEILPGVLQSLLSESQPEAKPATPKKAESIINIT